MTGSCLSRGIRGGPVLEPTQLLPTHTALPLAWHQPCEPLCYAGCKQIQEGVGVQEHRVFMCAHLCVHVRVHAHMCRRVSLQAAESVCKISQMSLWLGFESQRHLWAL